MTDTRLTGLLLSVAALAFASTLSIAQPASAAVACWTDAQCPSGTSCVDERCKLESTAAPPPAHPGADDECGADRRCRIRRLARKNRARRKLKAIREEQELETLVAHEQIQREQEVHRHAKPWTLNFALSGERKAGLMGGYSFTPHLKAELAAFWPTHYIYAEVGDQSVDGEHDEMLISIGPTYYFYESTVSPYLRGAFTYGTGEFYTYGEYGYSSGGSLSTETHVLTAGGGVDVQFELGFHMRLGLNYRMLLFNEASVQVGEYNDVARQALKEEFYPLDIVFLIGWAF